MSARWAWGNGVAVASAGVRGVVTLAAVFLLPPETPMREYLQFLAFVVVVASLLGGLALPAIIRRLKLPKPSYAQELTERRLLMAEARQAGIDRLDAQPVADDEQRVVDLLRTDAGFLGETLDTYGPDASIPQLESKLPAAPGDARRRACGGAERAQRGPLPGAGDRRGAAGDRRRRDGAARAVPPREVAGPRCRPGQNGSSGSIAIATNSSVRYVIDAWKTRIGRGSVPRTARL